MSSQHDPVIRVFDTIRSARHEGRSIVFLLGAGISVGAGIPVVPGIKQYLNQVAAHASLNKWPRTKDYLIANGWPARHQLAVDLPERFRLHRPDRFLAPPLLYLPWEIQYRVFLASTRVQLAIEALQHDLRRDHYPIAQLLDTDRKRALEKFAAHNQIDFDYRAALAYLCGDDRHLVDAFFDRLVRARDLAAAHQFVALIAKTLNSRLVLTTNFDDLVDSALAAEGRPSVVYELLADHSTIPHESLIRRRRSLVKLHGGTYSLSADFDLESELSDETLHKLSAYLPPNPLLIVLGYSGGDFRVMSFIRHVAVSTMCSDPPRTPGIIWIHRESQVPPSVLSASHYGKHVAMSRGFAAAGDPIQHARYRDGRLFLQELHQRLIGGHGVSRNGYRALLHTSRRLSYSQVETIDVCALHKSIADKQISNTTALTSLNAAGRPAV